MNKLAIVTGGSRGLGAAVSEKLQEKGYETYEFSRSGEEPNSIKCDFNDIQKSSEIIDGFLTRISKTKWDEILFINNAGVLGPITSIGRLKKDEISFNININLISAFTFISKFTEAFRDRNGRKLIVNISSGAALHAYAGWSLYCASKAGLEQFIRSLSVQEKNEKFPFCAVNYNPSVMDTDMQKEIRKSDQSNFPEKDKFLDLHRNGHLRTPESVASHLVDLINKNLISGKTYSIMD